MISRSSKRGRMPAPGRNCCNDSIAKEGCRLSVLGVGKDEESIVGIEVGICALHGGERGPSGRVVRRAKRQMCLSAWHRFFFIGAWKRCNVHCCGRLGGRIKSLWERVFLYAASARSTVLTPARCSGAVESFERNEVSGRAAQGKRFAIGIIVVS